MIKKAALFVAGILLILLGIAGLILPILPGWVFIFSGLSLISPALAERVKRWVWHRLFKKQEVILPGWSKHSVLAVQYHVFRPLFFSIYRKDMKNIPSHVY